MSLIIDFSSLSCLCVCDRKANHFLDFSAIIYHPLSLYWITSIVCRGLECDDCMLVECLSHDTLYSLILLSAFH
jgi:hypothetical protein